MFESATKRLAKVIDEPFMGRSHEAAKMNDRISELDARQRQEAAKIALLQADHDELHLYVLSFSISTSSRDQEETQLQKLCVLK